MISICPLCEAKIKLPAAYNEETRCGCPVCQGTFQMAQLMEADAPVAQAVALDAVADDMFMEELGDDTVDIDDLFGTTEPEPAVVAPAAVAESEILPAGDIAEDLSSEVIAMGDDEDAAFAAMLQDVEDQVAEEIEEEAVAQQTADAEIDFKLEDLTDVIPEDAETFAEFSELLAADETSEAKSIETDEFDDFDFTAAASTESSVASAADAVEEIDLSLQNEEEAENPIRPVPAFQFRPAEEKDGTGGRSGRRTRKSPLKEIAQVILGGVLACIIVQFILWWLPAKWRRDPLGLAPSLPDAVSFLAPESLRKPKFSLPTTFPPMADVTADEVVDPIDDEPPADDTNDELANDAEKSSSSTDLGDSFSQAQANAVDSDTADEPAVGFVDGPQYSPYDLGAALSKADDATKQLRAAVADKATKDAQKAAAGEFATALSNLADTVTFTTASGSDDTIASVRAFLASLASDSTTARAVPLAADRRLKAGTDGGVALIGKVMRISAVGALREVQVEMVGLGNASTLVTIVTVDSATEQLQVAEGQTVCVCGRLVDSPLTSLVGYAGDAKRVVWARHIFPVTP